MLEILADERSKEDMPGWYYATGNKLVGIEERKETVLKMVKYKRTVCDYVYDPELGDPDGDIKPGIPFEEIPDEWVCPVCGASKGEFEKMELR